MPTVIIVVVKLSHKEKARYEIRLEESTSRCMSGLLALLEMVRSKNMKRS